MRIRLHSTDAFEQMVSWNVIADLPGTAQNPEIVMLGCHYDGHDISQGAEDPASGTVAVMEAARVLAQYAGPRKNTIRFALWGIEEIGLIGSTAYVAQHPEELDRIRFYFNMDGAGHGKRKDVVLNEWPDLEPVFEEWQKSMALDFSVGESVSAHSDHYPFLMAGVPTGGMEMVEHDLSGRGYAPALRHARQGGRRGLREAAAMAARLAIRIADAAEWPAARRGQEAVAALFDKQQYQDEAAIFAKIRAYKEKLQG